MSVATGVLYRQSIRLADGRELIYYDRDPAADRSAPDARPNPSITVPGSQVRWDPLFEEPAVIAGHRQGRTHQPASTDCPLCPSLGGRATEIPAADYRVAIFENRFPAFGSNPAVPAPSGFERLTSPGTGRCEVVCFSSEHSASFADLPAADAALVLDALADRTEALAALPGVEYVFCFENRGREIGVTLPHPHGQVYAYPLVPPRFHRAAVAARRYREQTGGCLQCVMLEDELAAGDRVVVRTGEWVAYVPFAARWPYQVRIVPRRHLPDLPEVDPALRADLADVYQDVLRRFDRLFDQPAPYIAAWQQAPVRQFRDSWHLAVEVFTIRRAADRLKYLAGAESAAATWINDVPPELAARRLRESG